MKKIYYPETLTDEYYKRTIKLSPEIILTGYNEGLIEKSYQESRTELKNNYLQTFICDEWLDHFCFQDCYSRYEAPIERIHEFVETYFQQTIPLGCLLIAIKHRKEKHTTDAEGRIVSLIMRKGIYDSCVMITDYIRNQEATNEIIY